MMITLSPDNLKYGPVIAVYQMAIGSPEQFVFKNKLTESRKVLTLSSCGYLNPEFFCHALTL